MSSARVDALLGLLACAIVLIAAGRMSRSASPRFVSPGMTTSPALAPAANGDELRRAGYVIVNGDPFRLSRRPSPVRYALAAPTPVEAAPSPPRLRPTFTLKGIVGGPPWQAIIDGLPGAGAGAVVREGAEFGSFSILSVTRDTVTIQGPDTTWFLTIRRGGS